MIDKNFITQELAYIYNELRNKEEYNESIKKLNKLKIINLVNYYINAVEQYDLDDKHIVQLIILVLQDIYNNSGILSPVSDENYDKLYEINKQINNEDIVGAPNVLSNKNIINHKYPDLRGTLDKIHFMRIKDKGKDKRKSLEEWIKQVENKLERKLTNKEKEVYLFPKWDGLSVIFECDKNKKIIQALSRGDTDKNEAIDLTPLFKDIYLDDSFKNNNCEFGVKNEVVMKTKDYELFCNEEDNFNNERSAVSSILNMKELNKKYLKYLTIVPLQIQNYKTKEITLPDEVFNFYPYKICNVGDYDEIEKQINEIKKIVDEKFGIPIDGIVIRLIDKSLQDKLGRDDAINNYDVAYKFPPEQKKTKLINVIFSVGLLGAITPVAIIDPVKIKGNKITNISLGSTDRFEELNLNEGDEVIIKYDVIPYLIKDETCKEGKGKHFNLIKECPYCHNPLVKDPILKCTNINCESRIIGKILNYIEKMGIKSISIATVTLFFIEGLLKSIEDLYSLIKHERQIIKLPGFGGKSFANIIAGIYARKNVYDYQLLGSIGIPDIAEKTFKKILNIYYLKELIKICKENKINKLTTIGGIKGKTAKKIIEGINFNEKLINFLCSELNVKRDDRKYNIKVCFSNIRPDEDFEKYLDNKGVMILEDYTKEVNLLIIDTKDSTSGKVKKAIKDNKDIITIDEAYKIFEYKKGE
jgi:DNA ligase (NAD+)